MSNPFFKNNGPIKFSEILKSLNIDNDNSTNNKVIYDIKDLVSSNKNDITFFHSKKYKEAAKNTNASFCLTTASLKNELPKSCAAIVVDNVLASTSKLLLYFILTQ